MTVVAGQSYSTIDPQNSTGGSVHILQSEASKRKENNRPQYNKGRMVNKDST
jgi:hypothetical protein